MRNMLVIFGVILLISVVVYQGDQRYARRYKSNAYVHKSQSFPNSRSGVSASGKTFSRTLTANELFDEWDDFVGGTVTVLVPSTSMFNGATILYPLAGKANIRFHFPVHALPAVERIADDGWIRQKVYVRGVVNATGIRQYYRMNKCQLVNQ